MKEAIRHYIAECRNKGVTQLGQFPPSASIAKLEPRLAERFRAGELFIERNDLPAFGAFEREMGCPIPKEIAEYLCAFFHPGIFGYIEGEPECFMLFPVVSICGEEPERKLIDEAEKWYSLYCGSRRFLPIGIYGAYEGMRLLYDTADGNIRIEYTDDEGNFDERETLMHAAAGSLKELIAALRIRLTE